MKLKKAEKEDPKTPPHLVPLSRQAVAILKELQPLTGKHRYLFPGIRDRRLPMSENTINASLRRLGYDKDTMTGHGFRHMASTLLNEMGFRGERSSASWGTRSRVSVASTTRPNTCLSVDA